MPAASRSASAAFDTPVLRELLHFSLPLMPAGIALWGLNFADRRPDPAAGRPRPTLGSYRRRPKVALGVMLVVGAFQTAWPPFAHSIRGEEGARSPSRRSGAVFTYWAMVMGWAVAALTLISAPYIRIAFPENVHDAIPVVPLLMAGIGAVRRLHDRQHRRHVQPKTRMTPIICTDRGRRSTSA